MVFVLILLITFFSILLKKRFIIKRLKVFLCISKSQIIQINDIQKVILKKYKDEDKYFKIYFLLTNGKKITVIDTYDEKGEGTRALLTLKYFIPQDIFYMDLSTY